MLTAIKNWKRPSKCQLFNLKKSIIIENGWKRLDFSTFLIKFKPFLIKLELFLLQINFFNHILVRICIVATILIKFGDDLGSKKSIKRRFESDLKQVLAWGQLNPISLLWAYSFNRLREEWAFLKFLIESWFSQALHPFITSKHVITFCSFFQALPYYLKLLLTAL